MINHTFVGKFVFVIGLCAAFADRALCEPIPVAWSFRNPFNETAFPTGVSGGLTFPNTKFQSFSADQVILATPISSYSIASATDPDILRDQSYSFALDLRDEVSADMARLQLKGVISGTIWRKGTSLTNKFTSDPQTVLLGGNQFTVSLVGFDAPSGYGVSGSGGIYASVRVNTEDDVEELPQVDVTPNPTPEPGSLILCGLGLSALACAQVRRHRTYSMP